MCFSPDGIWPSLDFGGICGNANVRSLVDLIVFPFGRPTFIGGLLAVFCSWVSLCLM